MKELIVTIIGLLVFIGLLIFLYKHGNKALVEHIVYNLVADAEMKYGSGTSKEKYSSVISGIFRTIPPLLRLLFMQQYDQMIEKGRLELVKRLSTGVELTDYITDLQAGKYKRKKQSGEESKCQ